MIRYTVPLSAVAVSAAQDLFEIVSFRGGNVRVDQIMVAQYSDFADAEDEILSLLVMRGHTTAGSGGAAVTPRPWNRYANAAKFTAARNNTTVASAGTPHTLIADGFNVRAGYYWKAPPVDLKGLKLLLNSAPYGGVADRMPEQIIVGPSERLVLRITVPADVITMNATIVVDEFFGG